MISDQRGIELHDKVSRGEQLSSEEQIQLNHWYLIQDEQEAKEIGIVAKEPTSTKLQAQLESALAQLVILTNRLKEIATENAQIRKENMQLRQQLSNLLLSNYDLTEYR